MQASPTCFAFIKKMEGYSATAYDDGGGVWTVGWGTVRWDLVTPVKPGDTITVENAEKQLQNEVQRVCDALSTTIKVPLSQPQFDALVSLFYNIGTGWLTGVEHRQATLVKLLNQGKYTAIPGQLLRFENDIHGRPVKGLLTRRKWEAQMWLSDSHEAATVLAPTHQAGEMPQTVLPAKADTFSNTAKSSWTAWGAGTGLLATGARWVDSATGWSKDTAQRVLDVQNDFSPLATLGGVFLKNAEHLTLGITVFALFVVLVRRFSAGYAGKVG